MRRRSLRSALRSAALALSLATPTAALACDKAGFSVLVDVGHTPAAPGAISARGKTEYAFNVALAVAVEKELRTRGYAIVGGLGGRSAALRASRRSDSIRASGARLMLSIHHDSAQPRYFETWTYQGRRQSYSDRFKGWSLFVSQSGADPSGSLRFARLLADRLKARGWPFTRHHAEPIPGEGRTLIDRSRGIYRRDDLAVLRSSPGAAALLEAGVIVNRDEELALDSAPRRAAIAEAVGEAVDRFCDGS